MLIHRLIRLFSPVAAVLVLCWHTSAYARDPVAGQKAAANACTVCHGPQGISQIPNAPHLAGQPALYVAEQLKNYRSGKRQNEVMAVIAKPLSDQEIDDLAAWYASIQISVTIK